MADALRLLRRRPLGLSLLLVAFLVATTIVAALVPFAGGVLQLMALPLLTLGYMVASHSALVEGPVHPGQFIEPLRGNAQNRRALLKLCVLYGVLALVVLMLFGWMSGDAMTRLQAAVAAGGPSAREKIVAIVDEPGVMFSVWTLVLLTSLLSVPFWYAPALVHWGGQGVGQALFSSALAVWRSKGAITLSLVGWALLSSLGMALIVLLGALLGDGRVPAAGVLPLGMFVSTGFYVSQLFAFNDSFGGLTSLRDSRQPPPTESP